MHTVAVISEKGGVGKTTIALSLGVAASRNGDSVAVFDVDPQSTASLWTDRRHNEMPAVVSTQAARLSMAIQKAKAHNVAFVVIDTPPRSGPEAVEAARVADLVVMPVEPHIFSLETLAKAATMLGMAGNPPAVIVINKAPAQGAEAALASDVIDTRGLVVCPVVLHHRALHRHATNRGLVAAEISADSKAAAETDALYNYVLQTLANRKGKKGNGHKG
jgi:chromosome partitioning protein